MDEFSIYAWRKRYTLNESSVIFRIREDATWCSALIHNFVKCEIMRGVYEHSTELRKFLHSPIVYV